MTKEVYIVQAMKKKQGPTSFIFLSKKVQKITTCLHESFTEKVTREPSN